VTTTTANSRTFPERDAAFAHLDLADLRRYRVTLAAEENRVSYWRRLVQARLDLLRACSGSALPNRSAVRDVLSEGGRLATARTALVEILPQEGLPPLPDVGQLWSRLADPADPQEVNVQVHELSRVEHQLSAYRAALHRRIAAATAELIARYRAEPTLCLSVLPARPPAQRRAASD
jgi:hypothetical protein